MLDTSVLLAYFNEDDSQHERAVKTLEGFDWQDGFVSDYVVDEFLNLAFRLLKDKKKCRRIFEEMIKGENILGVSKENFNRALNTFFQENKLSLTDCTSMELCKEFGLELVTFDSELERINNS